MRPTGLQGQSISTIVCFDDIAFQDLGNDTVIFPWLMPLGRVKQFSHLRDVEMGMKSVQRVLKKCPHGLSRNKLVFVSQVK